MLLIVQVSPLVIILYFVLVFKQPTDNPGWILEEKSGCKCWTNRNFEHRSFTWTGDCSDGYADGPGVLHLKQDGYKHTVFEGTLSNGKATGFGRLIWLDGDRFEGEFKNGLSNGFGRLYNDDGDYYEGNFSEGQRSGKGTYWYEAKSQLLKYEGSWEEGLEHGQGTLFYRDGTQVSGTFNNGILTQANK